MENVIIVLLIGVTILAETGCGGSSNPESTASPTATAVPTDTPLIRCKTNGGNHALFIVIKGCFIPVLAG